MPARALAREDRDGVDVAVEAALGGERAVRRLVVGLGEAEPELARVAVGGAVDLAWAATADVADDELEGPSDRRVGAVALAERVDAGVHADLAGARAAADDHRPDRHRGGEQAVHVELVVAHRLDRGQHPRQVLGQAAGHDGGDRDLLDGGVDEVGRNRGDDLVGRTRGAAEHLDDTFLGRRHDRQTVGPAAGEHHLDVVLGVGDLDPARSQDAAAVTNRQFVDEVGVDALRAASGPHRGQPLAEVVDAGERAPLGLEPAERALGLDAVDDADQRRHGLDVVVPADGEILVEDGRRVAGERRVVLRVDGELGRWRRSRGARGRRSGTSHSPASRRRRIHPGNTGLLMGRRYRPAPVGVAA